MYKIKIKKDFIKITAGKSFLKVENTFNDDKRVLKLFRYFVKTIKAQYGFSSEKVSNNEVLLDIYYYIEENI